MSRLAVHKDWEDTMFIRNRDIEQWRYENKLGNFPGFGFAFGGASIGASVTGFGLFTYPATVVVLLILWGRLKYGIWLPTFQEEDYD